MRFLIAATTDPSTPKEEPADDAPFDEEQFAAYMKFNEELAKAGVLVASEGLNPRRPGARVGVKDGKRVLLDGPFTESKELIGGFYIIDVSSRDEAIQWALRCPVGFSSAEVLSIHPMTDANDIPPELMAVIHRVAPTWAKSFTKA